MSAKPNSKTAPAPGTAQKGRQKRRAPQASPAGGTEAGTGQPASDMAMSALGSLTFQLLESRIQHRVSFSRHSARFLRLPSHHWLRRGRITLQPRAPGVTRSLLGGARRSGRDGARMVSGPHEPHDCPRWLPSDQADPQGRPEATLGTWRRHGSRGDPTQPQKHHPLCTLRLDRPKIDPCPSPHFPAPYRLDPSESDARRDQCAVVLTCARIP